MNLRRADTLEDYEIKLAVEQAVRSEQHLQLDLKFEPEKKRPRSVIGHRAERAKGMARR